MLLSRLPLISAIVLLVIIAGSLYWQTAPLINSTKPLESLAQIKDTSNIIKTSTKKSHNIAKFKLFGDVSKKISKAIVVEENLPKTKLRLTLTGVIVSPTDAGALILGPDKQTQHYKIDDDLPGGATLKQVFPDRVILNRSGRLENLHFVETATLGIERFTPENELQQESSSTIQSTVIQNTVQAANDQNINSARSQSIKSRLSKLKKRLLKNKQ